MSAIRYTAPELSTNYLKPQIQPRQGCRLLQTVNLSPEMLQTVMMDAPRSLYNQSRDDEPIPYKTGMVGTLHGAEYWNPILNATGHNYAWGAIVSNGQEHLIHLAETVGASHDKSTFKAQFDKAMAPSDVTGWLRLATMGATTGEGAKRNAQPFAANGLVMIHNGSFKGAFDAPITREIKRWLPDEPLDAEDSDSRRIFAYTRSQLVKYLGSDQAATLPADKVEQVLTLSLQELSRRTAPRILDIPQIPQLLPVKGQWQYHASNFIFDYGNVKLAFRHTAPLYLWGEKTSDGHHFKRAILATEPMNAPGMVWPEIADNHVFTLTRQAKDVYDATMVPVGLVPKPSLPLSRYPIVAFYGLQDAVLSGIDAIKQWVGKLTSRFQQPAAPVTLQPLPHPA